VTGEERQHRGPWPAATGGVMFTAGVAGTGAGAWLAGWPVLAGVGAGTLLGGGLAWLLSQSAAQRRALRARSIERELTARLTGIQARIDNMPGALHGVRTALAAQERRLIDGSTAGEARVREIEMVTTGMASWVRSVGDDVERLSSSTEETSSSVFEMVATMEEIARHVEGLSAAVNETAGVTTGLVETVKGVDANVDRLGRFVAETSTTMEQVITAIRHVQSRTASSHALSEKVALNAEEGRRAVEMTIEGMNRIRASVRETGEAIHELGQRSQAIGGILNVIEDVAEQTNLLALNAAIIAAQAGEHGKGFAVVAEEIRGLAERTSSSTREIAALIDSFRREGDRARVRMEEGSRQVEDGAALSEQAGAALQKILGSARESTQMSSEIAQTTQEQAQGTHLVVEAVGRVREMVTQLSAITAAQTAGSESILSTIARMRDLTAQVERAIVEQAKGGGLITESIQSVTDTVARIHQTTLQQHRERERLSGALAAMRDSDVLGRDAAQQLSEVRTSLDGTLRTITDGPPPAARA